MTSHSYKHSSSLTSPASASLEARPLHRGPMSRPAVALSSSLLERRAHRESRTRPWSHGSSSRSLVTTAASGVPTTRRSRIPPPPHDSAARPPSSTSNSNAPLSRIPVPAKDTPLASIPASDAQPTPRLTAHGSAASTVSTPPAPLEVALIAPERSESVQSATASTLSAVDSTASSSTCSSATTVSSGTLGDMNSGSVGGLEEDLAGLVVSGGEEDLGGLVDARTSRTSGASRTSRTTRIPRINKPGWAQVSVCPSADGHIISAEDMSDLLHYNIRTTYGARHPSSTQSLRSSYLARIAAVRHAAAEQAHSLRPALHGDCSTSLANLPSPPLPPSTRKSNLREPGSTRPVKGVRFGDHEEREQQRLSVSVVHYKRWIEDHWGRLP